MPDNVLPFPHAQLTDPEDTPLPINARPGDTFLRIDITGHRYAHLGLMPGAFLVTHIGSLREGWPHLIEKDGKFQIARITKATKSQVLAFHWEVGVGAQTHRREAVTIVGAIIETYPAGLKGPRWVSYPSGAAARRENMDYPLVNVAAN